MPKQHHYQHPNGDTKVASVTFVNADSTTAKTLINNATGSKAVRVEALVVCSDDTSDRLLRLWHKLSSTSWLLGAVNIPTLSGTNGSAARVNMLQSLGEDDADDMAVIYVAAGESLTVAPSVAVTADKTVTITARYREYLSL